MTASGPCEVCKKVTSFYTGRDTKGWYCDEHDPRRMQVGGVNKRNLKAAETIAMLATLAGSPMNRTHGPADCIKIDDHLLSPKHDPEKLAKAEAKRARRAARRAGQ